MINKIIRKSRKLVSMINSLRVIDERKLYSLHEQMHLRQLLKVLEVDCVFDVGANRGQYATMLRRKAGYAGQIVSFEPMPEAVKSLTKLSQSDSAWLVEEVALSGNSGEREFNVMRNEEFSSLGSPEHGDVSLFTTANRVTKTISVKTETLADAYDRLSKKIGFKRPFLKMDTQGFDVEIFKSGGDIVRNFVGMQSELAIRKLYSQSIGFADAIDLYTSNGFELSAIVPNNEGTFPILVEMDAILIRKSAV